MVDYYRLGSELLISGLFALCLILFLGFIGLWIILSFSFTLLSICEWLIPSLLRGVHPLLTALLVGNLLTIVILLLMAGFNWKAYIAIASSMICSLMTCLLVIIFGNLFHLYGAVMDWSECRISKFRFNVYFSSWNLFKSCDWHFSSFRRSHSE